VNLLLLEEKGGRKKELELIYNIFNKMKATLVLILVISALAINIEKTEGSL